MRFEEQLTQYRETCNNSLQQLADALFEPRSQVSEAARYSLLAGGKRVRGVLVLAVSELLYGHAEVATIFAGAIEMIHAFSLIHDDLPCMDDDDLRRGKPSAHKVYGEAQALLAGDMLAIQTFEALCKPPIPAQMGAHAVQVLAKAAGSRGMIYGQELDLRYEIQEADEAALRQLHSHKTGALIHAAVKLGCCTTDKAINHLQNLDQYANNVGLVFQIVDDILDVTSSDGVLGKPVGSDREQGKTTFVSLCGLEAAKKEVQHLTQEAVDALQEIYGERAWFLCEYASALAKRVH